MFWSRTFQIISGKLKQHNRNEWLHLYHYNWTRDLSEVEFDRKMIRLNLFSDKKWRNKRINLVPLMNSAFNEVHWRKIDRYHIAQNNTTYTAPVRFNWDSMKSEIIIGNQWLSEFTMNSVIVEMLTQSFNQFKSCNFVVRAHFLWNPPSLRGLLRNFE